MYVESVYVLAIPSAPVTTTVTLTVYADASAIEPTVDYPYKVLLLLVIDFAVAVPN